MQGLNTDVSRGRKIGARVRTVPGISVQHIFDKEQFAFPVSLLPTTTVVFVPAIGHVLKAPSSVIPYPIDLGARLECNCRHVEVV